MIQIEAKDLIKMVDNLFYTYADFYRHDAKEMFTDMLSEKLQTGDNSNIRYQYEFTYEEDFQIRFNYIPGCLGDGWTPDTPEEVEIVEVLFFGEPLSVNQERAFIEENRDDLEDFCWQEYSRHQEDDWSDDMFDRLAKRRRTV